jgi:hypothetical protein
MIAKSIQIYLSLSFLEKTKIVEIFQMESIFLVFCKHIFKPSTVLKMSVKILTNMTCLMWSKSKMAKLFKMAKNKFSLILAGIVQYKLAKTGENLFSAILKNFAIKDFSDFSLKTCFLKVK